MQKYPWVRIERKKYKFSPPNPPPTHTPSESETLVWDPAMCGLMSPPCDSDAQSSLRSSWLHYARDVSTTLCGNLLLHLTFQDPSFCQTTAVDQSSHRFLTYVPKLLRDVCSASTSTNVLAACNFALETVSLKFSTTNYSFSCRRSWTCTKWNSTSSPLGHPLFSSPGE
uniref:Uncharacterized protein n=1 Tax=Molossus molossus TaxID=27622 RepID=A0A7J8ER16_MOLMO|nr:hypothetical protein HJG59_008650 [Molossus molossus]